MHNLEMASKIIVTEVELEGRLRGLVQLFHFAEKETEARWDQLQLEVTLLMSGRPDTDPGLWLPVPSLLVVLSDVFVLASVEVIIVKIIEYKKNTLWAFEVLKIFVA